MRQESKEEKYLNQHFGADPKWSDLVRAAQTQAGVEFMALSPHEARLLQFLVRGFGLRRIVEIGTLFGYSASCLREALPADGELITLEKDPRNWKIAQTTFAALPPSGARLTSLCGDAEVLLAEISGPFDMLFIDANKGSYADYLDWGERNVRRGGLIVGDNSYLFGAVWDEPRQEAGARATAAMKAFNLRLSDPARWNSILIPTGEGLTVAQKLF